MEMTEATETINDEVTCTACMTVPVSHLALEAGIEVPLGGWSNLFDQMGIQVLTDPAGRKAITTVAARKLLNSLRRRDELAVEAHDRLTARVAAKHPLPVGTPIPAQDGMSPYESMVAARGVVTVEQEFGGRPRPRFLQEEIEAGERDLAEKKRLATERAKDRLVDQMKGKLR